MAARGFVVLFGVVVVAQALLPVALALSMRALLDGLGQGVPFADLGPPLAVAMGAGVAAGALSPWASYLSAEIGRRATVVGRDALFSATGRCVGIARFEDPRFLDRLRLSEQSVQTIGSFLTDAFGLVRSSLTLVGFVGALVSISPTMTLFVLAAAVPAFVCQISLSRRRAIAVGRVITKLRRESFYSNLLHSPSAAKEIRLFDLGTLLRGRMLHERKEANAVDRALDVRRVRMELVLQTASAVTTAAGLAWGVYAAQRRLLTIGDLSVFVAAVAAVQSALTSLVHDLAGTHERLLVFRDFVAITAMPPDLPVPTSPIPCLALQSHIELQDVWFRYGDELPWVLRGVTLTIRRGESLGLVGVNGAGKSTLIKLLLRLYDPVRGRILWDGIDIREFDPRALRDRLSAVYQDFERYDFSASDNIAVGDPTAMGDRSRIVAAARHAGADRFLSSLPHGYDTQLTRIFASETEREEATVGVDLSGGQWQRVAVARAFVRGPRDLLILDEPNAGLDAQADHDIHTRVQQIAAGQTSLLVSHRLSAIRSADTIVVLDDGVIAETGDHDSLVASAGRYAQAFGLQASGYGATTVTPARAQHVVGR